MYFSDAVIAAVGRDVGERVFSLWGQKQDAFIPSSGLFGHWDRGQFVHKLWFPLKGLAKTALRFRDQAHQGVNAFRVALCQLVLQKFQPVLNDPRLVRWYSLSVPVRK